MKTLEQSLVIGGMPGIGKTEMANKYSDNMIYVDPEPFRWIYCDNDEAVNSDSAVTNRIQNFRFSIEYAQEIVKKSHEYDVVLFSIEPEILDRLKFSNCPFAVCVHDDEAAQEYIEERLFDLKNGLGVTKGAVVDKLKMSI